MESQNRNHPFAVQVTDGMVKFRRRGDFFQTRDEFQSFRWDLVEIEAARNEHEPFQVVILAAERDLTDVTIGVGAFQGRKGDVLDPDAVTPHLVHYIAIPPDDTRYPDALLPLRRFDLPQGETQALWFDMKIGKDVEADVYEGTVTVRPAGLEPQQVRIRLTVHRFTLPDTAPIRTSFGLDSGRIGAWYGLTPGTPEFEALYDRFYWFLVDHLISPQDLPVPFDPARMSRYLDDPRVTGLRVPYSAEPAKLEQTIRVLRENGWLDLGYFYPVDEPYRREEYDRLIEAARVIHEAEPQARVICPYYRNPAFAPDASAIEHLTGSVDIWCALTSYFHEDMLAERKAAGDEIWWYTCCVPVEPYPNLQIQMPTTSYRALFWLQRFYDIQGFLYWSVNTWTHDPYTILPPFWLDSRQHDTYSDGLLLYPGEDGPNSSIRLELIREALEDLHYLNLLEDCAGRDEVRRVLERVVGGPTFFEQDARRMMGVRSHIAKRITE